MVDRHYHWIGVDENIRLKQSDKSGGGGRNTSDGHGGQIANDQKYGIKSNEIDFGERKPTLNSECDPLFPFGYRDDSNKQLKFLNPFYEMWYDTMPNVLKQLRLMRSNAEPHW